MIKNQLDYIFGMIKNQFDHIFGMIKNQFGDIFDRKWFQLPDVSMEIKTLILAKVTLKLIQFNNMCTYIIEVTELIEVTEITEVTFDIL